MRKIGLSLVALVAAGSLLASPVLAKRAAHHAAVPCAKIKEAQAAGKSDEDVAKDLHTTAARVKQCNAPAKTSHKKKSAKVS